MAKCSEDHVTVGGGYLGSEAVGPFEPSAIWELGVPLPTLQLSSPQVADTGDSNKPHSRGRISPSTWSRSRAG